MKRSRCRAKSSASFGSGSVTSAISGFTQTVSAGSPVAAIRARRAAPYAGPVSPPFMRTIVKPVAAAIMRVHKALFAPPPIRPTRSIFAPAAAETIARVRECERDPLHHRARHVGARRRLAHSEQNATRIRIIERRALAAEIRQKENRAGAGIIRRRFTLERVRGRAEKPPGESERAGAIEHRRHRVPAVWQRMGESMHELLRRAHVSVGRDDKLRRGSERNEGFPWRDGAQAHRANGCVAAARRKQNATRQAQRVRGLRPDPARRRRSLE